MSIDDLRRTLERRLIEIETEADHLRALLAMYGGPSGVPQQAVASPNSLTSRPRRAARSVSEEFKPIYLFAAKRRDGVHLDELEAFAKEQKLPVDRDRIRQLMHNWKARNFFENPAQSVFRITPKGLEQVENNDGASSAELAPSSEIESRDEPDGNDPPRFDLLNHDAA